MCFTMIFRTLKQWIRCPLWCVPPPGRCRPTPPTGQGSLRLTVPSHSLLPCTRRSSELTGRSRARGTQTAGEGARRVQSGAATASSWLHAHGSWRLFLLVEEMRFCPQTVIISLDTLPCRKGFANTHSFYGHQFGRNACTSNHFSSVTKRQVPKNKCKGNDVHDLLTENRKPAWRTSLRSWDRKMGKDQQTLLKGGDPSCQEVDGKVLDFTARWEGTEPSPRRCRTPQIVWKQVRALTHQATDFPTSTGFPVVQVSTGNSHGDADVCPQASKSSRWHDQQRPETRRGSDAHQQTNVK